VAKYLVGMLAGHRFADKTLEDFVWSKENDVVKDLIAQLVDELEWKKGLGLVGDVGVGKTHLLASLYKNRVWVSIYKGGGAPIWVSFIDLVSEWKKDKNTVESIVKENDMIFVDDIWSAGMGMDEKNIIRELVLRSYDLNKILCYTANWSYKNWDGDERVKDRLSEMVLELKILGTSFREMQGVLG